MEAKQDIDKILEGASKQRQLAACVAFYWITLTIGYEAGIIMVQTGHLAEGIGGFQLSHEEISWLAAIGSLMTMPGNFLGGVLAQFLGRKKGALLVCPLFITGLSLAYPAGPSSVPLLYASKIILGFSIGLQYSPCASYFTEVTSPQTRTSVHTIAGAWMYLGLSIPVLLAVCGIGWQASSLLGSVFPAAGFLCISFAPESPVWLVSKGQLKEARGALILLRGKTYQYEEELHYLEHSHALSYEQSSTSRWNWMHRLTKPEVWQPFLIVSITFTLIIWVGTNPLDKYIVLIFQASGTNLDKYTATFVTTSFKLAGQLLSSMLLVRYKRKPIFMISSALISIGMIGLGISLLLSPSSAELFQPSSIDIYSENVNEHNITVSAINASEVVGGRNILDFIPIVCIALVGFATCLGLGPIPWAYASELFPSNIRSLTGGIISSMVAGQAFLQLKTFPSMSMSLGVGNTFLMFGGVAFLCILWGAFFLPETKGKTMLEISLMFNKSKKQHLEKEQEELRMSHQELKVLITCPD